LTIEKVLNTLEISSTVKKAVMVTAFTQMAADSKGSGEQICPTKVS
jgi:hypothetical protein